MQAKVINALFSGIDSGSEDYEMDDQGLVEQQMKNMGVNIILHPSMVEDLIISAKAPSEAAHTGAASELGERANQNDGKNGLCRVGRSVNPSPKAVGIPSTFAAAAAFSIVGGYAGNTMASAANSIPSLGTDVHGPSSRPLPASPRPALPAPLPHTSLAPFADADSQGNNPSGAFSLLMSLPEDSRLLQGGSSDGTYCDSVHLTAGHRPSSLTADTGCMNVSLPEYTRPLGSSQPPSGPIVPDPLGRASFWKHSAPCATPIDGTALHNASQPLFNRSISQPTCFKSCPTVALEYGCKAASKYTRTPPPGYCSAPLLPLQHRVKNAPPWSFGGGEVKTCADHGDKNETDVWSAAVTDSRDGDRGDRDVCCVHEAVDAHARDGQLLLNSKERPRDLLVTHHVQDTDMDMTRALSKGNGDKGVRVTSDAEDSPHSTPQEKWHKTQHHVSTAGTLPFPSHVRSSHARHLAWEAVSSALLDPSRGNQSLGVHNQPCQGGPALEAPAEAQVSANDVLESAQWLASMAIRLGGTDAAANGCVINPALAPLLFSKEMDTLIGLLCRGQAAGTTCRLEEELLAPSAWDDVASNLPTLTPSAVRQPREVVVQRCGATPCTGLVRFPSNLASQHFPPFPGTDARSFTQILNANDDNVPQMERRQQELTRPIGSPPHSKDMVHPDSALKVVFNERKQARPQQPAPLQWGCKRSRTPRLQAMEDPLAPSTGSLQHDTTCMLLHGGGPQASASSTGAGTCTQFGALQPNQGGGAFTHVMPSHAIHAASSVHLQSAWQNEGAVRHAMCSPAPQQYSQQHQLLQALREPGMQEPLKELIDALALYQR
jgi:hypothetical protein